MGVPTPQCLKTQPSTIGGHRCRVTSTKQKFDTLRGESMQYCGISCHIRSSLTAELSRSGYSSSTVPATLPPHAGRLPAAVAARGVHQREREVESAWLRPARRCVATAPWQECGEELAEREQRKAEVCQRKTPRQSLANGCRRSSP